MFLKCIIIVMYFVSLSCGANILAIVPTPSRSHQISHHHLWKELSLRGHKVTAITTDPMQDPSLVNLTEIDMKWSYALVTNISDMAENIFSSWNFYKEMMNLLFGVSKAQLSHAAIQELIANKTTFDVVFVEYLFPEFLGFADIFKCPKIITGSLAIPEIYHSLSGNPSHPVLHPDFVLGFYGPLTFKERLLSTVLYSYLLYFFAYDINPKRNELLRKHFNITLTLEDIMKDVDLIFMNTHPVLNGARALNPTTIDIGGFRPVSVKPLPKDLKEFLDSAKNGFIYFSLGSNVKSKELGEQTLKAFIETVRELPYKVLWKFEADELPGKPNNVKLVKWAPQQDVLAHPNLKLFITQGGLQSLEEGIYSEVPFVVIPFFADQDQNARLMEYRGIAKVVGRKPSVKKEELKDAILEVINDPKYKNSVKRLKSLILDNPMTGLEKAVWWTEYVIRHKGAKHLRNPAADLPLYQYYLLDVIGFLVLVALTVLSLLYVILKFVYKLFFNILIKQNITKRKKLE